MLLLLEVSVVICIINVVVQTTIFAYDRENKSQSNRVLLSIAVLLMANVLTNIVYFMG